MSFPAATFAAPPSILYHNNSFQRDIVASTAPTVNSKNAAVFKSINDSLLAEVVAARNDLTTHAHLYGIANQEPFGRTLSSSLDNTGLDTATSHHRFAFDEASATSNLELHKKHECNVNVFKVNWFAPSQKLAPMSKAKLRMIKNNVAQHIADQLDEWVSEIGVVLAIKFPQNVEDQLVDAVSITPLDFIWGPMLAYSEFLQTHPSEDDIDLLIRKPLLTCKCTIILQSDTLEHFWGNHSIRNQATILWEAVKRTAIQLALDIWESKSMLDQQLGRSLGAEATSKYWKEKVVDNAFVDMAPSLIDASFAVMKRWLDTDDPSARAAIEADMEGNNPIDSIYKYEAFIKKSTSQQHLRFAIGGAIDLACSNQTSAGELSLRQITGRGLAGGRGIVDLLGGKLELGLALGRKAQEMGLSNKCCTTIARWLSSHSDYRADMGYHAGTTDLQWLAALSSPDRTMLNLVQDAAFKPLYDVNVKQQKMVGAAVAELLDRDPIQTILQSIHDEMVELGLKQVANAAVKNDVHDIGGGGGGGDGGCGGGTRTMSSSSPSEPDEKNAVLAPWIELARQLYHSFCKLIVYPGSSTGVAEAIHNSAVKAKMADLADGEYVMPFIAQGWLVLVPYLI